MVTISRTDPRDVGQRQIYVRLDDGPTRTLLFGETVTETLPPGPHRLRANNTLFWKSVSFTLDQQDDAEFVVINTGGAFAAGMIAILGVAPLSLLIERRKPSDAETATRTKAATVRD